MKDIRKAPVPGAAGARVLRLVLACALGMSIVQAAVSTGALGYAIVHPERRWVDPSGPPGGGAALRPDGRGSGQWRQDAVARRLRADGVDLERISYPGVGHDFRGHTAQAARDIVAWARRKGL